LFINPEKFPGVSRGTAAYFMRGANLMASNIVEVTDNNFEQEVLKSDLPILVDFWAPWCGPCRAIAPVIEELSTNYKSRLKVAKCNVDTGDLKMH
jgi:thioredoxin-like negative regulator of GroEL